MKEIKIMDYLDAKEERLKALEVLKEKMLLLVNDYIEYATCDHPAHMNSSWKWYIENRILKSLCTIIKKIGI